MGKILLNGQARLDYRSAREIPHPAEVRPVRDDAPVLKCAWFGMTHRY
jgi:hypothetical protein